MLKVSRRISCFSKRSTLKALRVINSPSCVKHILHAIQITVSIRFGVIAV